MIKAPHWPNPLGYKIIDLGLERVRNLLGKLGNPHNKLPPVVHIAGTNGKGSTLAFLQAFLELAGYRVHKYTSPHLVWFNERIILNGKMIDDDFLYEVLEECRKQSQDIPITYFEGITVSAFLAFSKIPADIILLETGMGGRLDATNVIDNPVLNIISPISFDHTEYLGSTLEAIAYEKAGIMRSGITCVISKQEDAVIKEFRKIAKEKGARLVEYEDAELKENSFVYKTHEFPRPILTGDHQITNASTAITAAFELKQFSISVENIKDGLLRAHWLARLQRITRGALINILPKGYELWLDGGHNESAGVVLADAIRKWGDSKKVAIVVAMLENKDLSGFLKHFIGIVDSCIGVGITGENTCYKPHQIVSKARDFGIFSEEADSLDGAIRKIVSRTQMPCRILICGSLYLAGEVLESHE